MSSPDDVKCEHFGERNSKIHNGILLLAPAYHINVPMNVFIDIPMNDYLNVYMNDHRKISYTLSQRSYNVLNAHINVHMNVSINIHIIQMFIYDCSFRCCYENFLNC